MKKTYILCLIILLILLCTVFVKSRFYEPREKIFGKWKVTEHFCYTNGLFPSSCFYEHFLGRSIEIDEEKIVKSIWYWPDEVEYVVDNYRYMERVVEDASVFGDEERLPNFWYDKYKGQKVEVYHFYESENARNEIATYAITKDGSVLCQYMGAYLYMEPYTSANTNLEPEQLYGTWKVERLVSYQDGWRGNNAVLSEVRRFEPDTVYLEGEGAEFYPLDYYEVAVDINGTSVSLRMENGTEEQYAINQYESELVNTETYEKEKEIHDKLGITNEQIEIVKADIIDPSEEMLWDGEFVVVNETQIIIKLYQGWFWLVKAE